MSASENELFLDAIYTLYRNLAFTTKEINGDIETNDTLKDSVPDYLLVARAKSEASFVRSLGKLFARIAGRRYGANNIAVMRNPVMGTGSRTRWFVDCDDSDTIPPMPTAQDGNEVWV